MMTDPIADFLTRIRNAVKAGHTKVDIPASKTKAGICKVLKDEGFVRSFKIMANDSGKVNLRVNLKENAIEDLQRVSKPGLRIYRGYNEMPRVLSGLGLSIVSTSSGIISSKEARKNKVGGEILCNVW